MKNILIFIAFIVTSVNAQNRNPKEIGIGFAIANDPYRYEMNYIPKNLFRNKELSEKWTINSIFPYFLKPDYGLFHFICLEKTKEYYKVLVNDNEVGFLANDSTFYFITWISCVSILS